MSKTQELIKVTQEKLPESQVGLEIEIPPEMTQKSYEQVIRDFMRSATIPGFRKGKVPRQVVMQRLGKARIKAAAIEDLVQNTIPQAVEQEKIDAIGNYQLRSSYEDLIEQFEPGQALKLSASVDIPPEVKLGQYTDLKVQAVETEYDPAQVDAVLAEHQSERATLVPAEERPAQTGDLALVDFVGKLVATEDTDPEADLEIPGGQATDFQLELVEGRFVPGFVDGVIGMNLDQTKEVPVDFPSDYPQEELAGKAAVFTITLKEIKEKELPPLDDDFAQEVSEFETLAELRSFLEENQQKEAQAKTAASTEAALLDEVLKDLEVEIPETLVQNEVNYLLTQTASRLQKQGVDIKQLFTQETLPQIKERMRPEAVTRIKRTLVLAEVAKRESLAIELQQIEARVQEIKQQYTDQQFDPERLKEVVEEELLQEKVIEWLKEHAQVELVPEGSEIDPEASEAIDPKVSDPGAIEVTAVEASAEPPEETTASGASEQE